MIGYRVRRFVEAWRAADRPTRAFLAWNAANTVLAVLLPVGAILLLGALDAPGFQRSLLFGYIAVAVAWQVSIFIIGPAYDRVVPPETDA